MKATFRPLRPISAPSAPPVNPLARTKKPFAETDVAHTVVKAAEQMGWAIADPAKFLNRVQHVEYGLSAEMEFAAILRWLGWCSFVHRLNEEVLRDDARSQLAVPDLMTVFTAENQTCTALIEVKTSADMVLTFKTSYLQRLQAYARMMNQPLLIAWRPRPLGFWILFDPAIAQPDGGETVTVDFGTAVKNDLMSILAGDYCIVPKEGAGFRLEYECIGEKTPVGNGYEAPYRVSDAYFHDADGSRTEDVPDAVSWAIFSTVEDQQHVTDDRITQSFVASGGMTRAQLVLRTAAGFSLKEGERIHWKQVGKNLNDILNCDVLLRELQARFGTFVSYILYQQPQQTPPFLPAAWRGRSARGAA